MSEKKIRLDRKLNANAREVYFALTNPTKLRYWLCDLAIISLHPGGRVFLAWDSGFYTVGRVIETVPGQKIVLQWHGSNDPAPTQVTFMLDQSKDHVKLTLLHNMLGDSPEWISIMQEMEKGWEFSLDNLVSMIETGIDLRVSQRPLIGIHPEEYHHTKKNDPIPVTNAVKILDVVPNQSAEKAGLKSGDVIVAFNDIQVVDYISLTRAIAQFKAGDSVELTLYRGAERFTKTIELGHMPLPEIPESPRDLAEEINKLFQENIEDLMDVLEEVSESEADFRPAPEEWSIKEIIAHLIHSEREHQVWIGNVVLSQENLTDDNLENLNSRVRATVSIYPTLPELISAFKNSLQETVNTIALLPESVTTDKSAFWRLVFQGKQFHLHTQSHIDQIEDNLGELHG